MTHAARRAFTLIELLVVIAIVGLLLPAVQKTRESAAHGVNAALADGSVRFVRDGVDPVTYRNLGSRSDGAAVGEY